nr:NAD-dependent epimerase/dehydratase family protein [uncultured Desulfobacter sp.]
MKTKILLLGGTGVIGSYLVHMLNDKSIDTHVTSRIKRNNFGSIFYIQGNAKDYAFLRAVCNEKKWSAIIDFMSYKTGEFSLRLNTLLNSTDQYVFVSSARVYGNEEHPIKETSPRLLDCSDDYAFLDTDEYSLTKARQENLLFDSGKKNYTIVRPCITFGDERLQLGVLEKEEWLYRALKGRTIVFCKDIADRMTTMTTGYDMSLLVLNIIGNPNAIGEVIHFTSPYHRTWSEIYSIYEETLIRIFNIQPKMKMVSLYDFLHCRSNYLKYQVMYDRVYDRDYNTEKESRYADIGKFTTPEEGIKISLSNFIQNQYSFTQINWRNEGRKDKITKERTPFSEIPRIKNKIKYLMARFF